MDETRLRQIESLLAKPGDKTRYASQIIGSSGRVDKPLEPQFQVCDRCEKISGDNRSTVPTPIETDDKRANAWRDYLARWTVDYPCKARFWVTKHFLDARDSPDRRYYLRINFDYPDEKDSSDGVSPVPGAEDRLGLWPPSLYPDENTPRWLRANLLYHLGHELDEWLRFDGERVFDPHHMSYYHCDDCVNREKLLEAVPELIAEIRRLNGIQG